MDQKGQVDRIYRKKWCAIGEERVNLMEKENVMVYRPEDIAKILDIGRTSVYKLLKSGQLRSKRIGKLYRIPSAYLAEYLSEGLESNAVSDCR